MPVTATLRGLRTIAEETERVGSHWFTIRCFEWEAPKPVRSMPLPSRLIEPVKTLPPAYFALVMATGIVSVGAHLAGMEAISTALFWVNKLAFGLLLLLLILRLLLFFPDFLADLTAHAKGPGFFTVVAGSCVLGIQYQLLAHEATVAIGLWVFGLGVWLVLIYAFFVGMVIAPKKPTLAQGINGTWLLITVSTQSLAILGTLLAPQLPYPPALILFGTLCMFLLGFVFYLVFITLILYRLLFLPEKADDFTPPYWIDMGAVSITTLAGATLIQGIQATIGTGLADCLPFIKGISLLAWATATWWIPLIVLLEGWRYVYKRVPVTYTPQYWSFVFPLGMYMVCTWRLSEALRMDFLRPLAGGFIYVALVAWVGTFVGMVVSLYPTPTPPR